MSVTFVVVPLVVANWPLLMAAAAAAAASLGYKSMEEASTTRPREKAKSEEETSTRVELEAENFQALTEGVHSDDSATFGNENLRITMRKDARGRCTLHVEGKGMSRKELETAGTRMLQKIKQQYAYQKVAAKLEQKGFSIVQEKVEENQSIRIRFRKFD